MIDLIKNFIPKELIEELNNSLKSITSVNKKTSITESTNARKSKITKKPKYKKAKYIHHESVNAEQGKSTNISSGDPKPVYQNISGNMSYILVKVPDPRTRIKSNTVTQGKPIPSTRPFKAHMTEK